jgi:deazaflavin-dependent oxidoreductase (nitroreductase family)
MIPDSFWTKIKKVQRIHQKLYDSGGGWIIGWVILLLRHTGRISGRQYTTPLQYELIDGDYYIGAARGSKADWFKNIQADSRVKIFIGRKCFDCEAEPITDPEQIVSFLEYRLKHHPLMVGLMMLMHKLPMRPNQAQLFKLAQKLAIVKITSPVE